MATLVVLARGIRENSHELPRRQLANHNQKFPASHHSQVRTRRLGVHTGKLAINQASNFHRSTNNRSDPGMSRWLRSSRSSLDCLMWQQGSAH